MRLPSIEDSTLVPEWMAILFCGLCVCIVNRDATCPAAVAGLLSDITEVICKMECTMGVLVDGVASYHETVGDGA